MAWVRVDDGALSHPKIIGMVDIKRPFDLWIWGLSYAQRHLTDGRLPSDSIPKGAVKSAQELCRRELWEVTEGGYQIHDYLQWNDSREMSVNRKRRAKDRKQSWIERQVPNTFSVPDSERVPNEVLERVQNRSHTTPHHTTPHQVQEEKIHTHTEAPRMSGTLDDEIARRAGVFFRQWEHLFSEYRGGATYLGNVQVDYAKCCRLVEKFGDERLSDLAVVFLNSNEPFIEGSTRSLPVFASRISWCDEQLRKAEAKLTS